MGAILDGTTRTRGGFHYRFAGEVCVFSTISEGSRLIPPLLFFPCGAGKCEAIIRRSKRGKGGPGIPMQSVGSQKKCEKAEPFRRRPNPDFADSDRSKRVKAAPNGLYLGRQPLKRNMSYHF